MVLPTTFSHLKQLQAKVLISKKFIKKSITSKIKKINFENLNIFIILRINHFIFNKFAVKFTKNFKIYKKFSKSNSVN